ncbi:multiple sugar transport system permease protein, partial [Candidatus Hakubella thermalkaliphila]
MRNRALHIAGNTLYYFALIVIALIFIFPFVWMVSSAFKPVDEIFRYPPVLISQNPSLEHFIEVFQVVPFARYMWNSFFVSTTVTLVALLL